MTNEYRETEITKDWASIFLNLTQNAHIAKSVSKPDWPMYIHQIDIFITVR